MPRLVKVKKLIEQIISNHSSVHGGGELEENIKKS